MHLSEHFTVEEFEFSATAEAKGINNKMTEALRKEAEHTCVYMLEPLRKLLNDKYKTYKGKAVKNVSMTITSGYRCPAVNTAVGSKNTSQHVKAQATDIEATIRFTDGTKTILPYTSLYEDIKAWVRSGKLKVDQCIQERSVDKKGVVSVWVHLSMSNQLKDCRKQFLKYNNGTYVLDTK